ncbi:hypothetical protein FKM82_010381 [Ascaphus truei]
MCVDSPSQPIRPVLETSPPHYTGREKRSCSTERNLSPPSRTGSQGQRISCSTKESLPPPFRTGSQGQGEAAARRGISPPPFLYRQPGTEEKLHTERNLSPPPSCTGSQGREEAAARRGISPPPLPVPAARDRGELQHGEESPPSFLYRQPGTEEKPGTEKKLQHGEESPPSFLYRQPGQRRSCSTERNLPPSCTGSQDRGEAAAGEEPAPPTPSSPHSGACWRGRGSPPPPPSAAGKERSQPAPATAMKIRETSAAWIPPSPLHPRAIVPHSLLRPPSLLSTYHHPQGA